MRGGHVRRSCYFAGAAGADAGDAVDAGAAAPVVAAGAELGGDFGASCFTAP